jgi:tetratricopeptide (TPR) repeat protein
MSISDTVLRAAPARATPPGPMPFLAPFLVVALVSALVSAPLGVLAAEPPPQHDRSPQAPRCAHPLGHLAARDGSVTVDGAPAPLDLALCPGDELRTGADGRAAVRLTGADTVVRLAPRSTLRLPAPERERGTLDLLRGLLYFFSRTGDSREIRTPYVNAGVEGTEFQVGIGERGGFVDVFEGRVRAENPHGRLLLAAGESALAPAGEAPRLRVLVSPRDAVQWALYYPPVGVDSALAEADRLLRAGRLEAARERVAATGERADALALGAVIAVAANRREEAVEAARRAVDLAPASAAAWLALSYAEQAKLNLEAARRAAQRSVAAAPDSALARSRLAETHLALGDVEAAVEEAHRAVQAAPNLGRAQTVLGFAALARLDPALASAAFERAVRLSSQDPMAHLGHGLALIRAGRLAQGRRAIELAATLDPADALVRSYLGKAYYEERRTALAREQLARARELDPADPTPWFYQAILEQTENRPGEALLDLRQAMARNDNRAVYRSRLLLDQDRAARGVSLARVYTDLGFGQRALVEGYRALAADPANPGAHRFVADLFAARPRHELAAVSERLQAQMLQPATSLPVRPRLADPTLLAEQGAGPVDPGLNEHTALFDRNRLRAHLTGVAGNQGRLGDEVIVSGRAERFAFSVGQLHHESDGFEAGREARYDILDAFGQFDLAPQLSVQAEVRRVDNETGDLAQRFFAVLDPESVDDEERQTSLRLGLRYSPSPRTDLLVSVIGEDFESDRSELLADPVARSRAQTDVERRGYTAEVQLLTRTDWGSVTLGGGHHDTDTDQTTRTDLRLLVPPFIEDTRAGTEDIDERHDNLYAYGQWRPLEALSLTLGLAYERFEAGSIDAEQVNPKLGLVWDPVPGTTVRAAALRTLKRPLTTGRTLEPTQVAGFNQFFDDPEGSDTRRYGIGLDQRLGDDLLAGLELSRRDVEFPLLSGGEDEDVDERSHRAYLYWLPDPRWSLGAEVVYDDFERDAPRQGTNLPSALTTRLVPLGIRFHHPAGPFAHLTLTHVHQEVSVPSIPQDLEGEEDTWVTDLALGYRLPKRRGLLRLEVANLFDRELRYLNTDFLTPEPRLAPVQPERRIAASVSLAF